jgi:hypothetical protein
VSLPAAVKDHIEQVFLPVHFKCWVIDQWVWMIRQRPLRF